MTYPPILRAALLHPQYYGIWSRCQYKRAHLKQHMKDWKPNNEDGEMGNKIVPTQHKSRLIMIVIHGGLMDSSWSFKSQIKWRI